ncbi:MAG TPA: hypothetical protein P5102_18900, partial [Candidatus Competibacteraceae bacterium]|nr:hypothetical protein [Candidatus Competibacteraceae bacterium]
EATGNMVLEVGRLAACGIHEGLDTGGPLPSRLEDRPAENDAPQFDQSQLASIKDSRLIRLGKAFLLHLRHVFPLCERYGSVWGR